MVRQMLIRKSAPHPRSRNTPSGGRMMAKMILQMSLEGLAVTAKGSNRSRDTRTPSDELNGELRTYEAVKGMVTVERKRMGRERNAEMYFKRELRPHYIMMRHLWLRRSSKVWLLPVCCLFPVCSRVLLPSGSAPDPNCLACAGLSLKKKRSGAGPTQPYQPPLAPTCQGLVLGQMTYPSHLT